MPKTILIMRHAKSSWAEPGMDDRDRPLNERGLKAAPKIGAILRDRALIPDAILSSNALRAYTTAGLVAQACGYQGQISLHPEFYGAPLRLFYQTLLAQPDERNRILIVGHNPDLEELVEALSGRFVSLPTAALVQIELPLAHWSDLSPQTVGQLRHTWLPREQE